MKYNIAFTNQYLKDLQLARKRGLDESRSQRNIVKALQWRIAPKSKQRPCAKR